MNLSKEKRTAVIAAKLAGRVLLNYFGKKEKVYTKPNKSLVASADLKSNESIIKTIKNAFHGHSVLSEETGLEDNGSDFKWVIDPLDGTHNFLHGIPIFGISIALQHKGKVVFGVIHFPALKITAFAESGKGAFLNGKRIRVSNKISLDHSIVAFEFSYSNRKEKINFLNGVIDKTIDIRDFGAATYNLMLVACGKCEGFVVLSTKEWDIAAGFLIVEEAGGKITDLEGDKWSFSSGKYVASNGLVQKELLKYARNI